MKSFAQEVELEMAGKAVFEVMNHDGPIGSERPEWVMCAQTPKQDTARRYASAALGAVTPSPSTDVQVKRWLLEEHLPGGSVRWHCFEHERECYARHAASGNPCTITPLVPATTEGSADV